MASLGEEDVNDPMAWVAPMAKEVNATNEECEIWIVCYTFLRETDGIRTGQFGMFLRKYERYEWDGSGSAAPYRLDMQSGGQFLPG